MGRNPVNWAGLSGGDSNRASSYLQKTEHKADLPPSTAVVLPGEVNQRDFDNTLLIR